MCETVPPSKFALRLPTHHEGSPPHQSLDTISGDGLSKHCILNAPGFHFHTIQMYTYELLQEFYRNVAPGDIV